MWNTLFFAKSKRSRGGGGAISRSLVGGPAPLLYIADINHHHHHHHHVNNMDPLPLARGLDGRLRFYGIGPVTLTVDWTDALRNGGHGKVYRGRIYHADCGSLIMEVRRKCIHCCCTTWEEKRVEHSTKTKISQNGS